MVKEMKARKSKLAKLDRMHRRALRRATKIITGGVSGSSHDRRKSLRSVLKAAPRLDETESK